MSKKVSRRDFARTSVAWRRRRGRTSRGAAGLPHHGEGGHGAAVAAAKGAAVRRQTRAHPHAARGRLRRDERDRSRHAVGHDGADRHVSERVARRDDDSGRVLHQRGALSQRRAVRGRALLADGRSREPDSQTRGLFRLRIRPRQQRHHSPGPGGGGEGVPQRCAAIADRAAQHGFDGVRPTEALPDAKPAASYLSVVQLGPSGNTPVFRCPYHAWTYDLDGRLVSFPTGMASTFDASQNGLHPAHVRTVEGFIYISLALQEPPDFESFVGNWRAVCEEYGTAGLKIATRLQAPTKANWKLVIENFRECYHCKPSHTKSYSAVHQLFGDGSMSAAERGRIEQELAKHGHPLKVPADRAYNTPASQLELRDRLGPRAAWAWAAVWTPSRARPRHRVARWESPRPAPAQAQRVDAHLAVGDARFFDGVYPAFQTITWSWCASRRAV